MTDAAGMDRSGRVARNVCSALALLFLLLWAGRAQPAQADDWGSCARGRSGGSYCERGGRSRAWSSCRGSYQYGYGSCGSCGSYGSYGSYGSCGSCGYGGRYRCNNPYANWGGVRLVDGSILVGYSPCTDIDVIVPSRKIDAGI